MRPPHLEWPLFRWFRPFLEIGGAFTFFAAFVYVAVTNQPQTAGAALVPVLATYIATAALFFNRARALPRGPSKVRSLYLAERATQAAAFTIVGIIIGTVVFAWGAWFESAAKISPSALNGWRGLYFFALLFIQAGYQCFTFALRVLAREFLHPISPRELARRIRNAP